MERRGRYEPSSKTDPTTLVGGITKYVIVVEGQPVIDHRPGGNPVWMTYRDPVWATKGMRRVQTEFPNAETYPEIKETIF